MTGRFTSYTEADLIRKFESIERLFMGAKTDGEKEAAADALEHIKKRIDEFKKTDPPIEYKFTFSNMWSRRLFTALLRRYGLKPYRYHRQRYTTVMAKVSQTFVDTILWPEFVELDGTLKKHIDEITANIISKAIFDNFSEADVEKTTLPIENNLE
ncbi:MAG: hypothetical protein JXR80_08460 [Deltaproteobacteria bacterium]|nr:hypothetical protein [Deltaproteobacteria bacterium]